MTVSVPFYLFQACDNDYGYFPAGGIGSDKEIWEAGGIDGMYRGMTEGLGHVILYVYIVACQAHPALVKIGQINSTKIIGDDFNLVVD